MGNIYGGQSNQSDSVNSNILRFNFVGNSGSGSARRRRRLLLREDYHDSVRHRRLSTDQEADVVTITMQTPHTDYLVGVVYEFMFILTIHERN